MADPIYITQHEKAGEDGVEIRTKVWSPVTAYDSVVVLPYTELAKFLMPGLRKAHIQEMQSREVQKLVTKVWESQRK